MQNETIIEIAGDASLRDRHDEELWQLAKRRAALKISAFSYVSVNCLLIAIWYLTSGVDSYFWPIWPILGWGIGIVTQYFYAYHVRHLFSVEKEFEKLKNNQSN